jgi:hypothetical protein
MIVARALARLLRQIAGLIGTAIWVLVQLLRVPGRLAVALMRAPLAALRGYEDRTALLAVIWGLCWPFMMVGVTTLLEGRLASAVAAAPGTAVVAVVLFPWTVTRLVLIPLGLPRLAYAVASIPSLAWSRDFRGGAALAAAWALGRCRWGGERRAAWIEGKLARCQPLRGAGMVACALVAAWRGDLDGARSALWSVELGHWRTVPAKARELAAAWLAAEAAERGDWAAVEEIGRRPPLATPFTQFLAAAALRLRPREAPPVEPRSAVGLIVLWLLAPHRRTTAALLRAGALRAGVQGTGVSGAGTLWAGAPGAGVAGSRRLAAALALHAAVLRKATPGWAPASATLVGLARAWEEVWRDGRLLPRLRRRAAYLGTGSADAAERAVDELRAEVEGDLVALALGARTSLEELRAAGLAELALAVREEQLGRLEAAAAAVARRVEERRELPVADELREWGALRAAYDRAAADGEEMHRLAFSLVYPHAGALAVWLYNHRKEKPLGHCILRWLLGEAERVGDRAAAEREQRNVALGV